MTSVNERLSTSYRQTRDSIEEWKIEYNLYGSHTSLDGHTPNEFANPVQIGPQREQANL